MTLTRRSVLAGMTALTVPLLAGRSFGQETYPSKPVSIMIGNNAGSGPDLLLRYLGEKISPLLGQQIIVVNSGGGNSLVASEAFVGSRPDGYTAFVGSNAMAIQAYQFKNAPKPMTDFTPVSPLARIPFVLCVAADSPIESAAELLAILKEKGQDATYGASTMGFYLGELLKARSGIDPRIVRYQTAPQTLLDMNNKLVDYFITDASFVVPQARAGNLKMLAVTSGSRAAFAPDVPTMIEAGVPDYDITVWLSVFLPAGAPEPIVNRLNEVFTQVLGDPAVQAEVAQNFGTELVTGSPGDLAAFVEAELPKWADLLKMSGVEPQ